MARLSCVRFCFLFLFFLFALLCMKLAVYDRDAHAVAEAALFDGLSPQRQRKWEAASFPERNR